MDHRDYVIVRKICSEIQIAQNMMNGCSIDEFKEMKCLSGLSA